MSPLAPSRKSQAARLRAFIRVFPDSNLSGRRLSLAKVSCGFLRRLQENAATVSQVSSQPLPVTPLYTNRPAVRRSRG